MGMPGRDQPEFARGRAIQQPRGQHPLVDERDLLHFDALGVEGLRPQAAHPQGIVDDADVLRKQLLAHPVFQKARLARDRGAVDGADEMADQRCRHPGIVHDRHLAGFDLARIGARHGALARLAADAFGRREVGGMRRRGEIVVALHAGAFAGDRGHRDAVAGAQVRAVEAGRGHQHHAADAARGRRAAGLGHALDRKARSFGLAGAAFEFGGRGNFAVEQIEIGELARQQRRIGETDIFVVGRDAGHRDRALGEFCNAIAGNIVGRDHRLALPDQYAQSDIVAFGALGFLDPAFAHFDALRDAAHRDRVGGVRAGALGGLDQPLRQRRERRLIEQVGGCGKPSKAAKRWMVKSSQTKSLTLKRAGTQIGRPSRCA